jgi:hypothetical protein
MAFDLTIYRVGALARQCVSGPIRRPSGARLISAFRRQRDDIANSPHYIAAIAAIKETARQEDGAADFTDRRALGGRILPDRIDVFSMPPDVDDHEDEESSTHLVGLLPSERLTCTIGKMTWLIRVRASVTACALEGPKGFPKFWWTFEGVPANPDPDARPTERDAVRLLALSSRIEDKALKLLAKAYFETLSGIISTDPAAQELEAERVRLRFADHGGDEVAALIDVLRFWGVTTTEITSAKSGQLRFAREGLRDLQSFVKDSVRSDTKPQAVQTEVSTKVIGVEAVYARQENAKGVTATGFAQKSAGPTPYDHLRQVRDQRLRENAEVNLRAVSPARRFSGRLAGREAILLERSKKREPA